MKHLGFALILVLAAAFAGCSTEPAKVRPAPLAREPGDFDSIPDAEPKVEPLSHYGNPESYMVFGQRYQVTRDSHGYAEQGVASWYGPGFHEKLTSTREVYDMYAMTAAHKTLPLPTYAQVTNLQNGKRIIVRINDRGPFVDDRIIDLSYVAAGKLGLHAAGTGPVEVRAIDPIEWARTRDQRNDSVTVAESSPVAITPVVTTPLPEPQAQPKPIAAPAPLQPVVAPAAAVPPPPANPIYIQVGAFSNAENAHKLRNSLRLPNVGSRVQPAGAFYKVQIGPLASLAQADDLTRLLDRQGLHQTHYVTGDGNLVRR